MQTTRHPPPHSSLTCQRIRVSGIVQGVGFRPTVWRLAKELGLTGWVRADPRGVEIEACGAPDQIKALIGRLRHDAPPMAHVDAITSRFAGSVSVQLRPWHHLVAIFHLKASPRCSKASMASRSP